jgi:hypothetical protein
MFSFDFPDKLSKLIRRFDRDDLLVKLAGLGLMPKYQDNYLRISAVTQLTISQAAGAKRATATDVANLLNLIVNEEIGRREDPSEDVFVTSVTLPDGGDHRIFAGNFPSPEFFLQRLLNAACALDDVDTNPVLDPCRALLGLSEEIARRCDLASNTFETGEIWRTSWPKSLPPLIEKGRSTRFTANDLQQLGIDAADLEPFVLSAPDQILAQPHGANEIMAHPLLRTSDGFMLPIPSLVSPALRLFLSNAIARRRLPAKQIVEHLGTYLLGRWITYDLHWRRHPPLETEQIGLEPPNFEMPGDYAHSVVRFDEDKLAHIIILGADWSKVPDYALYGRHSGPAGFSENLNRYIRNCIDHLRDQFASDRGLTIVIHDSPGWWPENLDVDATPCGSWFVQGMPSSAFAMLLADEQFDLLAFWKMLADRERLEADGIRLGLWPDAMNFWTFWRELGGSFRPPDVDLDMFGQIVGSTAGIQDWVALARAEQASHGALGVDGEWERVERYEDPGSPTGDQQKRKFFQPLASAGACWRLVVETDRACWWISTARPPFSVEEQRYMYLLWQATHEWAQRLCEARSNPLASLPRVLELRLLPIPEQVPDQPDGIELKKVEEWPAVTIIVPSSFVERQVTEGNEGEIELLRAVARAAALASDVDLSADDLDGWVAEVASDPALKMMHVTYNADIGLAVDSVAERPPFRLLQEHDLLVSARAARSMLPHGSLSAGQREGLITDRQQVLDTLNVVVDQRWQRCRALLQALDREGTLVLVSRLIEAIQKDRVADERAALARTRLYASHPALGAFMASSISRRDGAFRSYRIIAEMAVCECPLSGGRAPGLSDIDAIAAEIVFLVANAEYSDAVKYGLVPSGLTILRDGAMAPETGGSLVAMGSYLQASLQEVYDDDVDSYGDLYSEQCDADPALLEQDSPFFRAYAAELGIGLVDAVTVSLALQELSVTQRTYVIQMRRSALLSALRGLGNEVDSALLDRFLNAFGLLHRPAWDEPPEPFRRDDIWPWLFERRLSLMMRPILITSKDDDPQLVYGVRQVGMAMQYVSHLFENGVWPLERLRSVEARAWVASECNRRGKAFEKEVAGVIAAGGWRTFCSLSMKRLGAPKKLGDLDVLAVSPDGDEWLVIECKWFGAARTAREVANWMQSYHGTGGDKLERHIRRHEWISDNKEDVAKRLGLVAATQVKGRIATTRPIPLSFTQNLPEQATVLTLRELKRRFPPDTAEDRDTEVEAELV